MYRIKYHLNYEINNLAKYILNTPLLIYQVLGYNQFSMNEYVDVESKIKSYFSEIIEEKIEEVLKSLDKQEV